VALQISNFQGSTVEGDVGLDVRIIWDSQSYDLGVRISRNLLTLWCDSGCTSWSGISEIYIPWILGSFKILGISSGEMCSSRPGWPGRVDRMSPSGLVEPSTEENDIFSNRIFFFFLTKQINGTGHWTY